MTPSGFAYNSEVVHNEVVHSEVVQCSHEAVLLLRAPGNAAHTCSKSLVYKQQPSQHNFVDPFGSEQIQSYVVRYG